MAGRSVNKVILVGNLGKDPELKYTPSGQPVTRFSLATNEKWKDKNGEMQERTEWHNIVCWTKLAEIANQYLTKGSNVYIEGRLQTRTWDDKDGKKHYSTEIIANDMVMLGGRGAAQTAGASRNSSTGSSFGSGSGPDEFAQESRYGSAAASTEITDDDIPF